MRSRKYLWIDMIILFNVYYRAQGCSEFKWREFVTILEQCQCVLCEY